MNTSNRLSKAYEKAKVIPYNYHSKFAIISDCHRGIGNWGDNFLQNQNLFFAALTYYYQRDFTYIELGDGDELWENRDMRQIIQSHSNAFWLMSHFYEEGRLYMIYGNHDRKKEKQKYLEMMFTSYYSESAKKELPLFPRLQAYEGIVLKNDTTGDSIFLTHGHQGDFINDQAWKLGRFLVRYVWRPLELMGVHDPTSAAKNHHKKKRVERRLVEWSREKEQMLIAGHTHRPVFPNVGETLYFNDGSCIHPRCMTGLEIEYGEITLVKWTVMTKRDRTMYVGREILEGPVKLNRFFEGKTTSNH